MRHFDILRCKLLPIFITFQEALSMVMPAMQLAAKVPDVYLQLWSASLVKGSIYCSVFLLLSYIFLRYTVFHRIVLVFFLIFYFSELF